MLARFALLKREFFLYIGGVQKAIEIIWINVWIRYGGVMLAKNQSEVYNLQNLIKIICSALSLIHVSVAKLYIYVCIYLSGISYIVLCSFYAAFNK